MIDKISIEPAGQVDLPAIKDMLREYADWMDHQHCFVSFEQELETLPGEYSLPGGFLLLAKVNQKPAGIIALKRISVEICEMKRLWVKKEYRSLKIGYKLISETIRRAKLIHYKKIILETTPKMEKAVSLYNHFSFSCDKTEKDIILMSKDI